MCATLAADMKVQNRLQVYHAIRTTPGQLVTRTKIGRDTGISAPTVLKIFDFLERCGIIVSCGENDSMDPGRKSSLFRFVPDAALAAGVTYDGHLLEMSLVNLNFETVKHRQFELTTDISTIVREILPRRLSEFTAGASRLLGIGVSLPASVNNAEKRICFQASPAFGERMSKESLMLECTALEKQMGVPVLLENDVNCAAIAEYRQLGLGEKEDLIYIMLAGGIGAGLVLDGRLRRGGNFSCGEIGDMVWNAECHGGSRSGYLEDLVYSVPKERYGIDLLKMESEAPAELVRELAGTLAVTIANLSSALDVSRFIIGGCVAEHLGTQLLHEVNARLYRLCIHNTSLSPARCGDGCARGAASLLILQELDKLLSDSGTGETED